MSRFRRSAVLAAVFVCAACGLVYELALVALGSYLIGDTAAQASIVLGVMVFAMGIGALAAKPLQRHALVAFAWIELLLALLGGLSVLGLYAAFAWLDLYAPALVAVALLLGALIGAEIPLLMVLLQRIRRQDAGSAVADLFAADYVGALLGGLAFPFLLLPVFGQLRGALVVGVVNAVVGVIVVFAVFRRDLSRRAGSLLTSGALAVLAVLGGAFWASGPFEVTARQQLYADPVVFATHSRYQEIVLTSTLDGTDVRLFLNGDLQFASIDEYRYHEALVHPALAGPHGSVLILGGGDGLALREVLKYPDVRSVTEVELDPAVIALARTDPRLRALNAGAYDDPRVHLLNLDAFAWLRDSPPQFDAIIVDMPDPDETATAKLYSVEFYAMVRRALAPGGRVVVQSGSPYFAPRSYWCVEASLREAGFATSPYHVDVPSFGDWGFFLAAAPPLSSLPPSLSPTLAPPSSAPPSSAPPSSAAPSSAPLSSIAPSSASSSSASSSSLSSSAPSSSAQPSTLVAAPLLSVAAPVPLRFLDADVLRAATAFPVDRRRIPVPPSTLMSPRILEYAREEWKGY